MLNLSEISLSFFYIIEHMYLLLCMFITYDLHNIYMLKNDSIEYKLVKYIYIRKKYCLHVYNLEQKKLIYIL